MKPISLRFRCFGPYMAEQHIDFTDLTQSGLFLICGETGAGKTTILDAICYALYGRSSGGLRGDMSVMRCKLAGKTDETYVEFIFDSGNHRYCFTRSLKYGRTNLNDSHNCMILKDDVFVPLFENPKFKAVNQAAEQLIGLTYDQFRQVIVLPQGQFEKLLVSNSEEKERILVSLFHADRWQTIADEIHRRVSVRDKALQTEKGRITEKLREYGCATIPALAELLAEKKAALSDLSAKTTALKAELETWRKEKETALLANRDFAQLTQLERQVQQLSSLTSWAQAEATALTESERAETITPQYRAYEEEKRQTLAAQAQVATASQKRERAAAAWRKAQQELKAHEAARPQYLDWQAERLRLEGSRALYSTLETKAQAAHKAEKEAESAALALSQAEKGFTAANQQWLQAMERQKQAIAAYTGAQELYLRSIGHTLASALRPGYPCPVCGSTHHPAPAQPNGEHPVTKAQLDQLNQAMNQANEAASQSLNQRAAAETARNQALTRSGDATRQAALIRQEYEAALAQTIPGIPSMAKLEARATELQQTCQVYEQQAAALTAAATDAEAIGKAAATELEYANGRLAERSATLRQCQAQWNTALQASGLIEETRYCRAVLSAEEYQKRKAALLTHHAQLDSARQALAEQRAHLAGKTAPDLAGICGALSAVEALYQTHSGTLVLEKNRTELLEQELTRLTGRLTAHDEARITTDRDLEFANRLRGRSGISLQRYVLGVMLTSVTTQANILLKNVCGGRYQLYRTDEIAGSARKGGLELEVLDHDNAERRSVTTLSGGEKFLVALSLAIGLSTVVQAQGGGIRLEAMFIDEGFGSLDTDAISDALDVLQSIGKSCGVVGIISHVGQLEESIPTKLRITKGSRGSSCRVCR